jgi:ABC-type antimicrobial peptide transport system permease subunit
LPEYGCEITWFDGYDESIFSGNEQLCIVPEGMIENYDNNGNVELYLKGQSQKPVVRVDENGEIVREDGIPVIDMPKTEYNCTLKIVGTYTEGDGKSIYCPSDIIRQVYDELEKIIIVRSLSATLKDNRRLDEFREKMSVCFLEPKPDGKKTSWNAKIDTGLATKYTEKSYTYALDINDNNLLDLSAILEDSIKFNRTVTVFVVILSVISGFLVGFLMVRRRKRDILLMRMVGESNARVYAGFALEQMICIILGIAIGGAYYMWNPMDKLAIFAIAYFVALSFALVIFMSKKLIKNVKEDE